MRVSAVLATLAVAGTHQESEKESDTNSNENRIYVEHGPCQGHLVSRNATCVPKGNFFGSKI